MQPVSFRSSSLVGLFIIGLCHCGSAPPAENTGDDGAEAASEALSSAGCTADAVLAAAPNAERRAVIERALKWVHDGVLYSQTATHEGYRRDCSGFVSMAWKAEAPGASTSGLAPYDTAISRKIAWSDLEAGDAVNIRAGGKHHVMLWGKWLDSAHTAACILQENHTGTPANVRAYPASYVKTFIPIRAVGMSAASSSPDPTTDPPADPGADPAADAGSDPAPGIACSSDGTCNPGSNGAGLICENGACVPGCRHDAQCPGNTRCSAGNCR